MPVKFLQKQAKPSLFKKKTVFKYKKNSRKIKKQPPKRIFIKRKVTWWTIFCATFLFPILVKVARAVDDAATTLGQHAVPPLPLGGGDAAAGAAVAGGAAAVGVAGASYGGLMVVISLGNLLAGIGTGTLAGIGGSMAGWAVPLATSMLAHPVGWIILGVAILAIAVFMGLAMMGVFGDCDCAGCAGCDMCGGSAPTSMDTTGVQQGASQQANIGTTPS